MENKKIIWLKNDDKEYFSYKCNTEDIDILPIYRTNFKWQKILRNILLLKFHIHTKLWFGKWVDIIGKYDMIIVNAGELSIPVVKYLNDIKSDIRIVVWFWNPIGNRFKLEWFNKYKCELWSFDEHDCERYNLNFNSQFYMEKPKNINHDNLYNICFVGKSKGREKIINTIIDQLDIQGITNNYIRVIEKKSDYIKYEEYISKMRKSICILDVVADEQYGLTLRPLEALFYKKKLITSNKNITKYPFYNKNNIFIIDIDDFSEIGKFLSTPYETISTEIVDYYYVTNWVKRFKRE